MKKNLRIVSAAAAALLAVAPVAVNSVASVSADTVVTGGDVTTAPEHTTAPYLTFSSNIGNETLAKAGYDGFVDLNGFNMSNFLSDSNIEKNIKVASNQKSDNPSIVSVNNAQITKKKTGGQALTVNELKAGNTYYLQAQVTINGLKKQTSNNDVVYGSNIDLPNDNGGVGHPTTQGTMRNIKVAVKLHFYDSKAYTGQPFFKSTTNNNNAYNNGQTIEAPTSTKVYNSNQNKMETKKFNLSTEAGQFESLQSLGLVSYNSSSQADKEPNTIATKEINYASKNFTTNATSGELTASNWTNWKNNIATPSIPDERDTVNSFVSGYKKTGAYTYTLSRVNVYSGKLATLHVYYGASENYDAYPLIKYTLNDTTKLHVMQGLNNFDNAMPMAVVKKGNLNWASDLIKKFSAQQSTPNSAKLPLTTEALSVDGGLDVNKIGVYNAKLTATNSNGLTTTLNFQVAVSGDGQDELSNVFVKGSANEVIKLVSIVDGKVSDQHAVVVNDGQPLTVYVNQKKTVNGVEYTRVASGTDSNLWIPTKNIQTAVPKKAEKTGTVKVMHNSYVYNEKHERVGSRVIATYSNVDVYGTKEINGKKFYRISADKEEYIDAANVDGTKRTLKHNAYIYATSKKRANKKVLKKGTTVTTYGSAVKFRNGKAYYRIEGCTASNKMYVKKANF